jgi:hypothetical protein
MVRTAPTVFLFLIPLALGSCNVVNAFLASTFPQDVTLTKQERDLSSVITSVDDAKFFHLDLVSVNGFDYLFLTTSRQTSGPRVIALDGSLNQIFSLTDADLTAMGGDPSDSRAKLDAAGRIVFGNLMFQPVQSGLEVLPAMPNFPKGNGFAVGSSLNIESLRAEGNSLLYNVWQPDWSWIGSSGPLAISASPTPTTNFYLQAFFVDPDPTRQTVALVLLDNENQVAHFLFIPMADFSSGLLTPLLDNYDAFSKPASNGDLLGYSQGNIIRFVRTGQNDGSFIRCDSSGADDLAELHFFTLPDIVVCFRISGGDYFTFDRETRVVKRMSVWWQKAA